MSKLLAILTVFSFLVGSCCASALGALAKNSHHGSEHPVESSHSHNSLADKTHHCDEHGMKKHPSHNKDDHCNDCPHDCTPQTAVNSFVKILPETIANTAKKENNFSVIDTNNLYAKLQRLLIYDRSFQFSPSLSIPTFHARTKRLRI